MAHVRLEIDLALSKVYELLSDPTEFPRWMEGIDKVNKLSSQSYEYETKIGSEDYKWTTNIIDDLRNTRFAWITINGKLNQTCTIRFTPLENGTRTRIEYSIDYRPFFGQPSEDLASFIEKTQERAESDIMKFKEMAETDAFLEDPAKDSKQEVTV